MIFRSLKLFILFLLFATAVSHAQTFREKIREKVKARMIKKMEEKPAPETTIQGEAKILKGGDYTLSLMHDNLERFYRMHVPASYVPSRASPLVVAFHGGGGDMNYQADDDKYKLISKSEKEGFIILFPNGFSKLPSGKLATWNAGKCCGQARDKKIDDVGFVRAMIKRTIQQLSIDDSRIYATGMSNGAMMSYRLACELPDVFRAIAAVAGTDNTIDCKPGKTISVLHIHALNDDHVRFYGGAGPGAKNKELVTDYSSVPDTVQKWVSLNQCNKAPVRILTIKGAYCDHYTGCKDNVSVKLCATESGAHSWPGGTKKRGETPSQAISANDMMWDFFKQLD